MSKNWLIGEAVSPRSRLTTLEEYEQKMNDPNSEFIVRVWRSDEPTPEEREAIDAHFREHFIGVKYPLSVARLWVYRFVNRLPWKIHGEWCTRIVWDSCSDIVPCIFDRPDGKKKKNPTPRTMENRLIAGVIRDISDEVIVVVDGRLVFNRNAIRSGDILAVRSSTLYGKMIRAVLGSYTNHNAIFVKSEKEV